MRKEQEMRAKLKALREANGYTQQTLSDAIGMSRSHYSQVESGDKQPSLKLALRIKRALNYYGDDIFDNTMPPVRKR
ncbi:helix-turn-helix transcriptional regulator [Blautia sp. AF19-13LB]|uniref:helix-turn-helix transcriptional regulator n=1 Tax=Blautia sp. AF19-13LB TaxID=2292962 RepID=UPI0013140E48|nr:helix-turn-helix domain-containing protein [Blautia sp. AF19-13LB]